MINLFKKKKKVFRADLPPPMPPEEMAKRPVGDLPMIVPDEGMPSEAEEEEMPELQFPALPEESAEESVELPPPPRPEMPARPVEKPFPKFVESAPKIFDKTIEEEMPSKKISRPRLKPIFVGVDDYKMIVNNTNVIRSKLLEAEEFAKRLNQLKSEETRLLDKWQSRIEDIDKQLTYVDKVVGKSQG